MPATSPEARRRKALQRQTRYRSDPEYRERRAAFMRDYMRERRAAERASRSPDTCKEDECETEITPGAREGRPRRYCDNHGTRSAENRRAWKRANAGALEALGIKDKPTVCQICKRPSPNLHLDHNHKCCPQKPQQACGQCWRGFICSPCNLMLGMAEDDPSRLLAAVVYLEEPRSNLVPPEHRPQPHTPHT